ncbi:MAG: permease [Desulfurivibrionaceae bacterium]|nr:permease [Desulfurivibrionaceae bacterium]
MDFIVAVLRASWDLLLDASVYIFFGIVVAGLLKTFLSTEYVARHLGRGRFKPVLKAALFGIPIPLCSCGVMPAAAALKRQGANNGATIAFLVSTPESGIDSISVSYALLDPIMTVARPVAAFISAVAAGLIESLCGGPEKPGPPPLITIREDPCLLGREDGNRQGIFTRLPGSLRYAFVELWGDLAIWFAFGLLLSGIITVWIPQELIINYLGGGFTAMLVMLAAGIPIYICASASTPIAAALILKGVSPGAALVFLLVGPATNMASLSILTGLLGKRAALRYLLVLAASSVAFGLLLDEIYRWNGISAQAVVGRAGEIMPYPVQLAGAVILVILSLKPFYLASRRLLAHFGSSAGQNPGCDCSGENCQK